jgi:hypothetical protein
MVTPDSCGSTSAGGGPTIRLGERELAALAVVLLLVGLVGGLAGRSLILRPARPPRPAGQPVARPAGELRSLASAPADGELYVSTSQGVFRTPRYGHLVPDTARARTGPDRRGRCDC